MPHHEHVKTSGTIDSVFAHRFVLNTKAGKVLADLTPKGAERVSLKVGDDVTLEGEQKPSEIKVSRLTRAGKTIDIDHHDDKDHHKKHHHDHGHDPAKALKSVRAKGYEVIGEPRGKPKHFEILARRHGDLLELHVELDGHLKHMKPVDADDPKWADALA